MPFRYASPPAAVSSPLNLKRPASLICFSACYGILAFNPRMASSILEFILMRLVRRSNLLEFFKCRFELLLGANMANLRDLCLLNRRERRPLRLNDRRLGAHCLGSIAQAFWWPACRWRPHALHPGAIQGKEGMGLIILYSSSSSLRLSPALSMALPGFQEVSHLGRPPAVSYVNLPPDLCFV